MHARSQWRQNWIRAVWTNVQSLWPTGQLLVIARHTLAHQVCLKFFLQFCNFIYYFIYYFIELLYFLFFIAPWSAFTASQVSVNQPATLLWGRMARWRPWLASSVWRLSPTALRYIHFILCLLDIRLGEEFVKVQYIDFVLA